MSGLGHLGVIIDLLDLRALAPKLMLELMVGTVAGNIIPVSQSVLSGTLSGSEHVAEIL